MNLLAIDWGTTSFRAALLDADGTPLRDMASADGILAVPGGGFASVLGATRGRLAGDLASSSLKTLMSGMVGSANGWQLAPYCPCPAGFDDVASRLAWVEPGRTAIVPGLLCEHAHAPDVMRGEETQIFGAMQLSGQRTGWFVLPGTHSKWAWVEDGRVQRFHTFMTGEVFAALSQHTILAKTVDASAPLDEAAFLRGVERAASAQFLHEAFAARTLALLERQTAAQLTSHLSGLCIGEELRCMLQPGSAHLVVIGSPALTQRYALALQHRGAACTTLGAECTWAGLHALAQNLA